MFVRPCWKPRSIEQAYELIEAHPWALLVTNGAEGPLATNLPLLLDRSRGPHGTLFGHIARANEQSKDVASMTGTVLAVFEGPYSYVTASWYPQRDMPSTYYYTAVHCYGRLRVQDAAALEAGLGVLNDRMERPLADGWRMDEIPHSEITRRLPGILGFELEIERLEAKFKLGQDEPKKDALAVAARLDASGDAAHRTLARFVRDANGDRPGGGA